MFARQWVCHGWWILQQCIIVSNPGGQMHHLTNLIYLKERNVLIMFFFCLFLLLFDCVCVFFCFVLLFQYRFRNPWFWTPYYKHCCSSVEHNLASTKILVWDKSKSEIYLRKKYVYALQKTITNFLYLINVKAWGIRFLLQEENMAKHLQLRFVYLFHVWYSNKHSIHCGDWISGNAYFHYSPLNIKSALHWSLQWEREHFKLQQLY